MCCLRFTAMAIKVTNSHEATAFKHVRAMPLTIKAISEALHRYMHDAEASRIHAAAEVLRSTKQDELQASCSRAYETIWKAPLRKHGKKQQTSALRDALTSEVFNAAQQSLR